MLQAERPMGGMIGQLLNSASTQAAPCKGRQPKGVRGGGIRAACGQPIADVGAPLRRACRGKNNQSFLRSPYKHDPLFFFLGIAIGGEIYTG